jgi:MFS superfamily sulfate permease-like transporter
MFMVVFVGVEQGIVVAIVLSLIDHTRRGYHPKNLLLVPGDTGLLARFPISSQAQALPGLMIYHFTHSLYFANCHQLAEEVTSLVNQADPGLRWFCIDASAVDDVDYSAGETLRSLHILLHEKGVRLVLAEMMEDVRTESSKRLGDFFDKDDYFASLQDILSTYRRTTD